MTRHRALVRVPLWLRLRVWLALRLMTVEQRELIEIHEREMDRLMFIFEPVVADTRLARAEREQDEWIDSQLRSES